MISWGTILYGAVLSGAIAAVALLVLGERRPSVLTVGTLAALIAPIGWNAVLRATHAREFFTDAPISVMPASWQDTGSGVVTLAVASLLLAAAVPREPLRRAVLRTALVCAATAFLVDVYLY
ncbi:MAG: hypothetical protein AB1679_11155 [Actinomycetota bacterium]